MPARREHPHLFEKFCHLYSSTASPKTQQTTARAASGGAMQTSACDEFKVKLFPSLSWHPGQLIRHCIMFPLVQFISYSSLGCYQRASGAFINPYSVFFFPQTNGEKMTVPKHQRTLCSTKCSPMKGASIRNCNCKIIEDSL